MLLVCVYLVFVSYFVDLPNHALIMNFVTKNERRNILCTVNTLYSQVCGADNMEWTIALKLYVTVKRRKAKIERMVREYVLC